MRMDNFTFEERLEHAAYHEAGHLVLAMLFDMKVDHAFISPTTQMMSCPACLHPSLGHTNLLDWKYPSLDFMTMVRAGEASEYFFLNCRYSGNPGDRRKLKDAAQTYKPFAKQALRGSWTEARDLIERNKELIDIFALALLKYNLLNAKMIESIYKETGRKVA